MMDVLHLGFFGLWRAYATPLRESPASATRGPGRYDDASRLCGLAASVGIVYMYYKGVSLRS